MTAVNINKTAFQHNKATLIENPKQNETSNSNNKNGFFKNAAALTIGGLFAKAVGAFYRIPLTNIIGAEGIGLYQAVFPLYAAMLTLSSTGLPIAVSKLISSNKNSDVISKCLLFFGGLGALLSLIMFVLGDFIGSLQGVQQAGLLYKALSPSVFFVSVISCFRGYFQGKGDTFPTAFSQLTEQITKAAAGLFCCNYFGETIIEKAFFAVLAVSISELVTCCYLFIKYVRQKNKTYKNQIIKLKTTPQNIKITTILLLTIPIAFSSLSLPLGNLADSFIILNNLKNLDLNAERLFGIYSGCVPSIIGLPIALCYGACAAAVPLIKDNSTVLEESLRFTALISIPCALFAFLFSPQIIDLLYSSLTVSEKTFAVYLLRLLSVNVILTSFLQTANACLIANSKQNKLTVSMYTGLTVRIISCYLFIAVFKFGIFSAAAAEILSLTVSLTISFAFLFPKIKRATFAYDLAKALTLSLICLTWAFYLITTINSRTAFIVICVITALIYLSFSFILFGKRGFTHTKKLA